MHRRNQGAATLFFEKAKPNFAGEWIIHECTCGTGCGYPFMWNARSGEVYRDFPFGSINVGPPWYNWRGLIHTAQSRILAAEGYLADDDPTAFRGIRYYLWNGQRFMLLYQAPLPKPATGPRKN